MLARLFNGKSNPDKSKLGIIEDMQIGNRATVPQWTRKCREVAVQICMSLPEPIGGSGTVVEIDESMFGKRNINNVINNQIYKTFFLNNREILSREKKKWSLGFRGS